jgi:transcriptional regulator with XRE-family HTH domain
LSCNYAGYAFRVTQDAPNRIRAIREDRAKLIPAEFTQAGLARRVGVTAETLRSWERGESRPRQRAAKRLARALGVTVEALELDERAPADHASSEPPLP